MMMRWLIDETGEVWPANSERLISKLELTTLPSADRAEFAVTNFGFVMVEQLKSGLVVRWRPTFVCRESIAATVFFLSDQVEQRVVVETIAKPRVRRLYPNVASATRAIVQQFSASPCDDEGHFVSKPRDVATLGPNSRLRWAFEAIASSHRRFDPVSLWTTLQRTMGDRYILLDPVDERRRLRVMSIGFGYTKFDRKWSRRAPGSDIEDQPDTAYARSAVQGLWTAHDSKVPIVEDVDATIWVPSRGRSPLRYTRLVLPLDVAGKQCILTTSELISESPET